MQTQPDPTELISELIGLIYEAAADLTLWPQLLELMSGYLELALPDAGEINSTVTQAEGNLIRLIAPHFERANALHQQWVDVSEERNLLENVMNRLPLGAAIIDGRCNAISLNRTLISLLQGNELLKLVGGQLVSMPQSALEQAVERVMSKGSHDEVVRIGDEQVYLSLWICKGGDSSGGNGQPGRLILLVASRTTHALSEQGLISLFGLTAAEARITQKLALGCTLEESATQLEITRNTAKSQLARVFSKVGVKRQVELLQAIYASPLWLQSDPKKFTPLSVDAQEQGRSASDEQYLKLSDGRRLCFSDSGDPGGLPVILMHGIAGSRYLRHPDDKLLMQQGVRLIIPERPGSGDSDSSADRRITDWPLDIAELADHLQLQQFTVLGYSAGTAYALAVAAACLDRVRAVHIVAALPPIDGLEDLRAYNPVFRMTLFLARYAPGLLPPLMRVMVKDIRKNVYHHLEQILQNAPAQDRAVLANAKLRANIASGMRASVRNGEHEVAREVMLVAQGWGVDLDKLTLPVCIWHGEQDPLVSIAGARKLAGLLSNAELISIAGAGHYLLYSHWQTLLSAIHPAGLPAGKNGGEAITHVADARCDVIMQNTLATG
ncbi:MAG: alpha/beta hydrolase [Gallionella sp.]|jgi:pimeloyl-ACP methyl ester carboxylesterase/DNA-binding CsgD family transcriptional regulator